MQDRLVLVTGATGRQGGAVIEHLRKGSWRLRALTRTPTGAAADRLRGLGVEVVGGSLDDEGSLRAAVAGAYGVFSIQNHFERGVGEAGEVRQAQALAAAAKAAGVAHFVQASMAGGAPGVPLPAHVRAKHAIEAHLAELDLPRTIVRGVFYADNFLEPRMRRFLLPILLGALPPETRLHLLAVDDVGRMIRIVFDNPERYLGVTFDVASDVLTLGELAELWSKTLGRRPPRLRLPTWVAPVLSAELAAQLEFWRRGGAAIDMKEVRDHLPRPTRFQTFLAEASAAQSA